MRFEEQITGLCAQALAAVDESEVQQILTELRRALHEHIRQLRDGLLAAYAKNRIRQQPLEDLLREAGAQDKGRNAIETSRTWQQIVHQIAGEEDHNRALQLTLELTRILQQNAGARM